MLLSDQQLARLSAAIYAATWREVEELGRAIGWQLAGTVDHADCEAGLFLRPRDAVLVFRGTEASRLHLGDLAANVRLWPSPWAGRGHVHPGYADHLARVAVPLWRLYSEAPCPVTLAGHSMGGALATLMGALACHEGRPPAAVVSFGAPAVFWRRSAAEGLTCPVRRYVVAGDPAALWAPLYRHPAGDAIQLPAPARLAGPFGRHDADWYGRAFTPAPLSTAVPAVS